MNEIWKDINGYEGIYEVSSFGRVRSVARKVVRGNPSYEFTLSPRIIKAHNHKGYLMVSFGNGKVKRNFFVHRLVAEAFLPDYFDGAQINHKDENRSNNHVDNLEWCTSKYNNNYGHHRTARYRKVVQIKDGKVVRMYDSIIIASKETHIHVNKISDVCRGKRKTTGGFEWRYAE